MTIEQDTRTEADRLQQLVQLSKGLRIRANQVGGIAARELRNIADALDTIIEQ